MKTPAELAYALVTFAVEGTIEKAVNQVNCSVKEIEQTRHTDEGVNFLAVDAAENFDLEIAVDFAY